MLSRQKTQTYEIVWCMLGTILGSLSITAFLSFAVVIFYPINLLNSLSSSCRFSDYFLRFFTYIILTLWPRICSIMVNTSCDLRRMYTLKLLDEAVYRCQLYPAVWQRYWLCPYSFFTTWSISDRVLESPSLIVDSSIFPLQFNQFFSHSLILCS